MRSVKRCTRAAFETISTLVVVLIVGASCEWPAGEPQAPLLQGNPAQPQCGFTMAPEPSVPQTDPCSAGSLVLGPETFTRGQGAPLEELRTFSLAEPGAICLLVDNQGTSSARIELDGIALLTPNELNPHIRQLTVTANVAAGSHDLSVKLASSPGSVIAIEVRFAQTDITPTGRVVGDKGKVVVWGLADTPDPFSPANHNGIKDVTTLSAVAQVLHLDGAPSFLYGLH